MVVVPVPTPVTMPEEPTVATLLLVLLHVPPDMASVRLIVAPVQTSDGPVIIPADGGILTVTISVA